MKPVEHTQVLLGDNNVTSVLEEYRKLVDRLVSLHDSSHPLIVNTMGFTGYVGQEIILKAIEQIRPTHIVNIVSLNEKNNFPASLQTPGAKLISLESRGRGTKARLARETNTISYLSESRPITLDLKNTYVYIHGQLVKKSRILQALNASLVALCQLPQGHLRDGPMLVPSALEADVLGWGIVIGCDTLVLHLLTPLDERSMEAVNLVALTRIPLGEKIRKLFNTG